MKKYFLLIAVSVIVSLKSLAQISGPTVVCPNSVVNYQVTVGDGIGAGIYRWHLNGVWNKTLGNSFSANILIPATGSSHTISVQYIPTAGTTETYYLYANSFTVGTASSGNSIVCAGTNASVQLNGYVGSDLVWQRKDGNGAWYNVDQGFGFNPNLNAINITQTTYFQAVLNTGACGQIISNMITINVYSNLNPGTIGGEQTICYNTTAAILNNASFPTGSTGAYTYQWQYYSGSTWVNIGGATSASYSPGALTNTTQYRRLANTACQSLSSNTVTVTVYPPVTAGTINTAHEICSGSAAPSFSASAATGGNYNYAYQWQYSSDNSNWYTAPGTSNNATYAPPVQTSSQYYRRRVVSCGQEAYSPPFLIAVYAPLNAGTISNNSTTICSGSAALTFVSNSDASGSNGSFLYQWEQSVDNSNWSNASGVAYTPTYAPQAQTVTTYYRRKVSACNGTVYSNTVTIAVFTAVSGGTIANASLSVCPASAPAAFTSTLGASQGNGSYIYQWEQSSNNVNWVNASGSSTSATYAPPALNNTMYFRRRVSSCGQLAYSNTVTIQVFSALQAGSIASTNTTICSGTAPASITSVANATGSNGAYTYQWQQSTDGNNWINATGSAASSTYAPPVLENPTHYRRSVSACGQTAYSNTVVMSIYAPLKAGSIDISPKLVCSGVTPSSFTNQLSPTGGNGYVYVWEQSADGINFIPASGANTGITYSPPALSNPIYYRRRVNSCGTSVVSNVEFINVSPSTVAGVVNGGLEAYGVATGNLALSDHNGVVQKWQQKVGNGNWSDINSTATTLAYSNVNTTTQYRAVVKSGACPELNTAAIGVVIYDVPSISIQGNASIPAGGSTSIVSSANLYSYQWYRNNQILPGETASTLTVTKPGLYKVAAKASATSPIYTTGEAEIRTNNTTPLVDMNYVMSFSFNKYGITEQSDLYDLTTADYTQNTTYFDGLGRPVQSVALGAAGNGSDLITPIEYDAFGREAKKYLPYAHADRDGRYQPGPLTSQSIFYNNTSNKVADDIAPYSQTIFEPSPLNRVIKQGAPGLDWQPNTDHTYNATDHTVKYSYEFNQANEVLQWTFTYPTEEYTGSALNAFGKVEAGTATAPIFYPANQLYKNKTKDEQGNQVIEYVDKEGRTVLKRVQVVTGNPSTTDTNRDTNWASTYYIYDDFGNLVCVIPPEPSKRLTTQYFPAGSTETTKNNFLKRWAFRYRYDGRQRMIMKQVPGAEPVFMVYDDRDRLVLTQDGNQRSSNGRPWMFTKYDALNRPIATGLKDTTVGVLLTQAQMQALVDNFYTKASSQYYEDFVGTTVGNLHGYSNKSFPTTQSAYGATVGSPNENYFLTVTYYDDYLATTNWGSDYQYSDLNLQATVNGVTYNQPDSPNNRVKGQVTATKVKVLDGGTTGGPTWLKSINYYDDKYRVIQNISDNYKGGIERLTNLIDFSGKVLLTNTEHVTRDIAWQDISNLELIGNKILSSPTKVNAWGNGGAASTEQLPAGQNGWIEFTVFQGWGNIVLGLSDQNVDNNHNTIDYGIYFGGASVVRPYENGVAKSHSPYGIKAGDILKIERLGTQIRYYQNGILLYTSTVPSTTSLVADIAIFEKNLAVSNVRTSFSQKAKTIKRRFDYDHVGRLINTWHSFNNQPEILLAHNEYNELGQLIDKKLHVSSPVGGGQEVAKQSVDYAYNIRGWLTHINDAALTPQAGESKDYFGMELAYNTDLGTGNPSDKLQFNGNINAMKWSNNQGLGDQKENAYNFTYDALNRLKTADFKQKEMSSWGLAKHRAVNGTIQSVDAFKEHISSYDLNGNIMQLQRSGQDGSLIDNLTYSYGANSSAQSNRLFRVTDAGDDTNGFKEQNSSIDDYAYDNNGNITIDRNKSTEELVTNGEFTNGSANWSTTESTRLNFINNRIEISAGAAESVITQQAPIRTSTHHIINYSLTRTSITGSVNIRVGSSSTNYTLTSSGSLSILTPSNGTSDVKIIATPDFAGYIESISVHAATAITYNYLNLPETVNRGDDGSIRYIYTATGQKLAQVVTEGTKTKTTDYVGEYVYENDTLLFVNHEEGRISLSFGEGQGEVGGEAEYQYHLKDHLGNVRLTFTTKEETEATLATLETTNETEERGNFLKYDDIRKVNSRLFDHTHAPGVGSTHYAMRLSGTPQETYGLARSIAVMPGDVISAEVFAKYVDLNDPNVETFLENLAASIAAGTTSPGVVIDGGNFGTPAALTMPFGTILNKSSEAAGTPKAYLNWIVLDKNFRAILSKSGYRRVTTAASENGSLDPTNGLAAEGFPHERLFTPTIEVTEPGYVYIYLSNEEAGTEVYFDDFKVTHTKSPVIQSDSYYPFGLTFDSYQRENSTRNKYLYNDGTERQEDLDLNVDATKFRMYDPAMGRWWQVDPLAAEGDLVTLTPYNYSFNNPIRYNDPNGDCPTGVDCENFVKGAWNSLVAVKDFVVDTYNSGGQNIVQSAKSLDALATIAQSDPGLAGDMVTTAAKTSFANKVAETGTVQGAASQVMGEVAGGIVLGMITDKGLSKVNAVSKVVTKVDNGLPDNANVVRGGTCKCEQFENGSGVTITNGNLNGVSVNSTPNATVAELSAGIPNSKVGTTTVGSVRKAGGNVVSSPTRGNPNHATLSGITGKKAEELFTPVIPNPAKRK